MKTRIVFSPETVSKVVAGKPYITFSRKSGLISVSAAAFNILKADSYNLHFYDGQGFIQPNKDGFQFRA